MIAITLSSISALSLALVVMFDRLMVADAYRNRPDHAWMVSSVAGAAFGLVATAATWVAVSFGTEADLGSLLELATDNSGVRAWSMLAAGVLSIQVVRYYYRLFAPDEGEGPVNETAIAMWLATTPLFIYLTVAALQALDLDRGTLSGLDEANVSWLYGALVVLTVGALLRFEASSDDAERAGRSRYVLIAKLLVMSVAYILLLSAVLRPAEASWQEALAHLPFYWIGFGAGARLLLIEEERAAFGQNWRRMRRFLVPIVVAELFGMLVFFSEFFALGDADPTLVNLIISSHVLIVFLLSVRLSRLRSSMEVDGRRRIWFAGLRLTRRRLPVRSARARQQLAWLLLSAIGLAACVYVAT